MTKSDSETFWDRLGEAMKESGLKHTQVAASALINSKGNTAAKKWQDGGKPSMTNAITIAEALGVTVEWLLTGRGSKYPLDGPMTDAERRVLGMWRRMTPGIKRQAFSQWITLRLMPDLLDNSYTTEKELEEFVVSSVRENGEVYESKSKN